MEKSCLKTNFYLDNLCCLLMENLQGGRREGLPVFYCCSFLFTSVSLVLADSGKAKFLKVFFRLSPCSNNFKMVDIVCLWRDSVA